MPNLFESDFYLFLFIILSISTCVSQNRDEFDANHIFNHGLVN